jgi:hypothetical protein
VDRYEKVGEAPERLSERSHHVEVPDCEGHVMGIVCNACTGR